MKTPEFRPNDQTKSVDIQLTEISLYDELQDRGFTIRMRGPNAVYVYVKRGRKEGRGMRVATTDLMKALEAFLETAKVVK